jgi:hypothetical protein
MLQTILKTLCGLSQHALLIIDWIIYRDRAMLSLTVNALVLNLYLARICLRSIKLISWTLGHFSLWMLSWLDAGMSDKRKCPQHHIMPIFLMGAV